MRWIYLSPHYDDAIFSCGGLIWQQTSAGDRVEVLTICGGDPPQKTLSELFPFAAELHKRWNLGLDVAARRRAEDAAACVVVGAEQAFLDIPDCIYRVHPATGLPLIEQNDDLFQADPHETAVTARITAPLSALPADVRLVVPLALGRHIDHRLVRQAAEMLGRPLLYYADFPYATREAAAAQFERPLGSRELPVELSPEALEKWVEASAHYRSQISTFWSSRSDLAEAVEGYYRGNPFGHTLWVDQTRVISGN